MDALSELQSLVGRRAKLGTLVDALPRLRFGRSTQLSEPISLLGESMVALVVQGAKRTGVGSRMFEYGAGQFLVASVKAPVTIQISRATVREPYLAVALLLKPSLIASLLLKDSSPQARDSGLAFGVSKASDALLDAFRRYVRLLDEPRDLPVLADAIEREILWRVMQSPQGAALREIGLANSQLRRISHAIDLLEKRYAEPVLVAELAREAHMSPASFNRYFRKATAMSPMQFQKHLRLQEARAQLLARTGDVTSVSFAVGYQSPSQFSREYRRQFGLPPGAEAARLRK